jgi:hypothetical protein
MLRIMVLFKQAVAALGHSAAVCPQLQQQQQCSSSAAVLLHASIRAYMLPRPIVKRHGDVVWLKRCRSGLKKLVTRQSTVCLRRVSAATAYST